MGFELDDDDPLLALELARCDAGRSGGRPVIGCRMATPPDDVPTVAALFVTVAAAAYRPRNAR
jgi:hypothetical protein